MQKKNQTGSSVRNTVSLPFPHNCLCRSAPLPFGSGRQGVWENRQILCLRSPRFPVFFFPTEPVFLPALYCFAASVPGDFSDAVPVPMDSFHPSCSRRSRSNSSRPILYPTLPSLAREQRISVPPSAEHFLTNARCGFAPLLP